MEGRTVEFNNAPFTVTTIRRLDCQFDKYYYKEHQGKSDRTWLQGTRKIGCQAHIIVCTITLYTKFQLSEVESARLGAQSLKEKKKGKLAHLYKSLSCGEPVITSTKYHVLLLMEEAHHSSHETRGAAGYAQRIDPKFVEKFMSLYQRGLQTHRSTETSHTTCAVFRRKARTCRQIIQP